MEFTPLTVSEQTTDQRIEIAAVGELDWDSEPRLRRALAAAVADTRKLPVLLELSRLAFMDSHGIRLLVSMRRALAAEARTLQVRLVPGSQPDRLLRLGKIDTSMPFLYQ